MTTKKEIAFPRVNFVALLGAALFMISLFLYWWGLDTTGALTESFRWSLWSGPSRVYIGSGQSAQALTTYSPVIGVLVIASAGLVLLGMIPKLSRLLIGSSVLAIIAPIVYAIVVNQAVATDCGGMANCISGPFGTETFNAGIFSLTVNWGFQPGFYVEIVGAIISIIAIAFQRTFVMTKN